MNYKDSIAFLFDSLPMYQKEGGIAFKPGLDNTYRLLKELGNPQKKFKAIHVAGTNGKGSVSHMLCAIFMKCGHKTGLYTSPHLIDYRERIRVNGKKVKKSFVQEFVKEIKPICEKIKPSFFELSVAMAFKYFAYKKVEYAVIETGLGGRLDATNVLKPILTLITNIGLEHMQYLGNTLGEIAGEKAETIKKGVPVVIGETHAETMGVFLEKAKSVNAEIHFSDELFNANILDTEDGFQYLKIKREGAVVFKKLWTDMNAGYQAKNILSVLMACEVLGTQNKKIRLKKIEKALKDVKKQTGLMGRWDVVAKNPMIVLDTAHNADGFESLKKQLKTMDYNNLYIIYGTVRDKDLSITIPSLPKKAFYLFTSASMPRSMDVLEIQKWAYLNSLKGITCTTVKTAFAVAMGMAGKKDLILITGSNFIVAEAMKKIDF